MDYRYSLYTAYKARNYEHYKIDKGKKKSAIFLQRAVNRAIILSSGWGF